MHELGVAQRLLSLVLERAEMAGAQRIASISVGIGEMSSLTPLSLTHYFGLVNQGTAAEKAAIDFKAIPCRFCCLDCGDPTPSGGSPPTCARCGSPNVAASGGRELRLLSLGVEDEASGSARLISVDQPLD